VQHDSHKVFVSGVPSGNALQPSLANGCSSCAQLPVNKKQAISAALFVGEVIIGRQDYVYGKVDVISTNTRREYKVLN